MSNKKQISYTGRDFPELKETLLNYVKQYYPDYFNSINDYTTEMMLIELMSVIGDINNFYIDDRFRELFIQHAEEPESVFRNAKELGYNPKTVSVATGTVQLSQIVPRRATLSGGFEPDTDYCAKIPAGTIFSNNINTLQYRSILPTDMRAYENAIPDTRDVGGNPLTFRIFKNIKVRSGINKTKNIQFTTPIPYAKVFLDSNVAFVESVVDSSNNKWYEVEYLAQDLIFEAVENTNLDENSEATGIKTPFKLKTTKADRRFVLEHLSNSESYLKFGSGTDSSDDNLTSLLQQRDILNSNEIASQNFSSVQVVTEFINSMSYGVTPSNTTLTVNYVVSQGDKENAKVNSITNITRLEPEFKPNVVISQEIRNSFAVTNREPITGGQFLNDIEKIRREASDAYLSQNRCVTKQDYAIRAKVLPSHFGNIDKVQVFQLTNSNNYHVLQLFVTSRTVDNKVSICDTTTKENLKTYLERYKMITDIVEILDPVIINIGVEFKAVGRVGYEKSKVLLDVCKKIEEFFHIDNWDINEPIVLEELKKKMFEAEGVAMITSLNFVQKLGSGEENDYSNDEYDVSINGTNFKEGVLEPPLVVGIFELKFPSEDIKGEIL